MVTAEILCQEAEGVTVEDIELWIENKWLRPSGRLGCYRFEPIDEARARLIVFLRRDIGVNDDALPVILLLIDQLYAA